MLRKLLLTVLSVVYATILSAQVSENELKQWEADAKIGKRYALYNLGLCYDLGTNGYPVDKAKAVEYYTKAAEGLGGDHHAKVNLGVIYADGDGVEKDMKKAYDLWISAAAADDDSLGCYHVSKCYLDGEGTKRDVIEGINYLYKSARNGYKPADTKLKLILSKWEYSHDPQELYDYGYCYLHGTDTTRVDTAKAVTYFQRSAKLGNTDAEYALALLHLFGRHVDKDADLAIRLFELSASKGDARSQTYLGFLYDIGYAVKLDTLKAVNLYKVAASKDFAPAQFLLATRHMIGNTTDQLCQDCRNTIQHGVMYKVDGVGKYICSYVAIKHNNLWSDTGNEGKYMRWSAMAGFIPAQYECGLWCYNGRHGMRRSEKEGLYWLKTAGDAGYLPAQYQYEYLPANDWKQRYALSLKYAEMGVMDAQYDYAQHMRYDRQADWVEAAKWYEAAAEQGDTESMKKLGEIYKQGGFKLKKDWSIALKWFENYAQIIAYDYDVLYTIGDIYAKGDKTVMKDPDKAIKYYLRAYNCALYESKRKDMIKKLKKLGYKIQ